MFAEIKMTVEENARPVGSRIRGKEISQLVIVMRVQWIMRVLFVIKKYKVDGIRTRIRINHR